jgi:hypothetical protein
LRSFLKSHRVTEITIIEANIVTEKQTLLFVSPKTLKSNIRQGNPSVPQENPPKIPLGILMEISLMLRGVVAPLVIYISHENFGGDMKEMLFEKRDVYTTDHFVMDDAYIDHYAKVCGVYASCVYMGLCRYADRASQSCSPSISLIARKLNISTRQVIRVLKILEAYNIIRIERTAGEVNKYWLNDRKHWRPADLCHKPMTKGHRCHTDTGTSVLQTLPRD